MRSLPSLVFDANNIDTWLRGDDLLHFGQDFFQKPVFRSDDGNADDRGLPRVVMGNFGN